MSDIKWTEKNFKEKLIDYVKKENKEFIEVLGSDVDTWKVKELQEGVGNLNYIYFLESSKGSLVVKWAPPYLRVVGESWALDPIRGKFEAKFIELGNQITPNYVPKLYKFDQDQSLIFMENLQGFDNLKYGLIQGKIFPKLAEHLSEYLSQMLFYTSDLYLTLEEKMKKTGYFSQNSELCKLTQGVIFQEPYYTHKNNKWTNGLDDIVKEIQSDNSLKKASLKLLDKFRNSTQALIHADLHTASVMANKERTCVIDGEFCFYGPMGFDLGKITSSLFINYLAQKGLSTETDNRDEIRKYLLETILSIWTEFKKRFLNLWNTQHRGDLYINELVVNGLKEEIQQEFIDNVFRDALGFASVSLIRRVIGIASNPDMLAIKDEKIRVECETNQLKLGRDLLNGKITSIEKAIEYVKNL